MDTLADFPQKIAVSSRPGAQSYTLIPGYYAIHGQPSGGAAPGASYLLNDGQIAVFEGLPDQETGVDAPGKVSPVYSLGPGGSPAVPTGLVFIRFPEGAKISERTQEIKEAGFEVAEPLAYAPHAAWLRSQAGAIADALNGLRALEKIPNVESVEPQMLMETARR